MALRLRYGAVRPAHQILRLALDPEMRRVIGDVSKDRYEWTLRETRVESFRPWRD